MKVNLKTFPEVSKYSTSYHGWSSLSREYEKQRRWKEDFEAELLVMKEECKRLSPWIGNNEVRIIKEILGE